jgi:Membrane dipeptidase (Peptidase family M19)
MGVRKILLLVFLLAFVSFDTLGRDFSAIINKTGSLVSGVGVRQVVRSSRGLYELTFERPINGCRVSGTLSREQTTPNGSQIITELGRNGTSAVFVETRTPAGTLADYSFRLDVNCPEPSAPPEPLKGYVDLHTHPLANVGFGGKLLYGGVDIGALLPADPNCNQNVRAKSMEQALGHDASTHGLWLPFTNPCGDSIRAGVIFAVEALNDAAPIGPDSTGFPKFPDWPVWNDITHQKMWVDWIERAYQSGLRVMVALAVNNKTLADATAGPCDYPTDDRTSTDLQLAEIKGFVARHPEFMEIPFNSDDLQRIVRNNKLAVVLGTEIDFFGNLNKIPQPPTNEQIRAEIDRLYSEGVRYMFPIHVLDNPLGGTAAYVDLFNYSTFREMGHYLNLDCATLPQPPDDMSEAINYHFTMNQPWLIPVLNIAGKVKLGTTFPSPPAYHTCSHQLSASQPTFSADIPPNQPSTTFDKITFIVISAEVGVSANDALTATVRLKNGTSRGPFVLKAQGDSAWDKFTVNGGLDQQQKPLSFTLQPAVAAADITQVAISLVPPASGGTNDQWSIEEVSATLSHSQPDQPGTDQLARSAFGQQNVAGLVEINNKPGEFAINEMMRHGIMIDIDHMSDASKTRVLQMATTIPGGYPVNSGHNGLRGFFARGVPRSQGDINDRSSTKNQYQQIANLHGMAGVGSANLDSYQWAELYLAVLHAMGTNAALAFGTDTDGFAPGMPPHCDPPITSTATTCQSQKGHTTYPFTLNGFSFDQMRIPGTVDQDKRKFWDYDSDGVAHYGMFAEFLQDVTTYPGDGTLTGKDLINNLMGGAEYFYQTWKICEAQKANVP